MSKCTSPQFRILKIMKGDRESRAATLSYHTKWFLAFRGDLLDIRTPEVVAQDRACRMARADSTSETLLCQVHSRCANVVVASLHGWFFRRCRSTKTAIS